LNETSTPFLETVKKAKERQKKCCLLIGAGCSVKAGVPLASGFVDIIKSEWSSAYARATEPKHYPQCMAELAPAERRDLIAKYVDTAKINWAHVAIAQLMKHGYVDRVLTTNFDPLVVRACAMVGHYPAVYDFAASQVLKPADIPGEAVFYLHGQRNGFVLMNTREECAEHAKKLEHLFQDAGQGRVWIAVGYSGENDPVFDHLASVKSFDDNLYWIGYQDNEPAKHVRSGLLQDGKFACYVKGFDADDVFVTLTQRLGCFPPRLVAEPFSHLDDLFKEFTDYKAPQQEEARDITEKTREMIRDAIRQYEQPAKPSKTGRPPKRQQKTPALDLQVTAAYMAGDYDKVIQLVPADQEVPPELVDQVSWSYINQGITLCEQARQKSGAEADRLLAQAGDKYSAALRIKPDMHEALNNWGTALAEQAEQMFGAEADRLFAQAGEKFDAALRFKPDKHEALYNWGLALYEQAKQNSGVEADRLFAQAGEKFEAALRIKPDLHEALNNWGIALLAQAKQKSGAEAERLFAQAGEKCLRAEEFVPGHAACNLACISSLQGREQECRTWLEKSRDHGKLPSKEHLRTDTDLDSVRGKDWFQSLINDDPDIEA
jgi:tetratricopeptide (TPR) repeat protein